MQDDIVTLTHTLFDWREFACGSGAAFINVSITYPINKIIFRQMLHGVPARHAFRNLRVEGIFYLYRGILPPLCQKTLSLSLMYGVYDTALRPLYDLDMNHYLAKFISSMASGTMEATLMPFERVLTLLADAKYHTQFKNTFHVLLELRKYGIAEYYRGFVPIFLRNGPSTGIYFILKDDFRELMDRKIGKNASELWRTLANFVYGAVIGAAVASLFYPLNVVKVAMQKNVGGKYRTIPSVFWEVYEERGSRLRGFYHGLLLNCGRSFLSWGIINAAYEQIAKAINYY